MFDKSLISHALIVAGGSSQRMGGINKITADLGGVPLIIRTLSNFISSGIISKIIIVTSKELEDNIIYWCRDIFPHKQIHIASGGSTRQKSVYNGLLGLDWNGCSGSDLVMVHDGARPFISRQTIINLAQDAKENGACTLAVPLSDTIKKVNENHIITQAIDRENVWRIQTPQVFTLGDLLFMHKKAEEEGFTATDDTALYEKYIGGRVKIIQGSSLNIKVTTADDLHLARAIEALGGK